MELMKFKKIEKTKEMRINRMHIYENFNQSHYNLASLCENQSII
jgi:hypothetical protein